MTEDPLTESAKATGEIAKAAQEIAKTTNTGLEMTRDSASWVARMLGPVAENLAGSLKDRTDLYRAQNFVRLHEKWQKFRHERGLADSDWRDVSPKLLLPALEDAVLEDEDTLQDLWARLLASATDPTASQIRTAHINIIKELSPEDARFLDFIFRSQQCRVFFARAKEAFQRDTENGWYPAQIDWYAPWLKLTEDLPDSAWPILHPENPNDIAISMVDLFASLRSLPESEPQLIIGNLQRVGYLTFGTNADWKVSSLCNDFFRICHQPMSEKESLEWLELQASLVDSQ